MVESAASGGGEAVTVDLAETKGGARMEGVRIDKWMWAARFFKTRALAADACEMGRIECKGQRAKASREARAGDVLRVKTEGGEYVVEVLVVSGVRGPAAMAQTLYRETEESRAARERAAAERREMLESGGVTEGRPDKRNRRELSKLRGRIHRF